MKRQPARVLEPESVRLVLAYVEGQRYPKRNRVMVLLSFKAGLRACEIAGLDWSMLLKSNGEIDDHIRVAHFIAKRAKARIVPMHHDLRAGLKHLYVEQNYPSQGPVIKSERAGSLSARSVVNWFGSIYGDLGLNGCSSHSGRRTFITTAARQVERAGGSLRDVQRLAGHSSLNTTELYIQGSEIAQRKLVELI